MAGGGDVDINTFTANSDLFFKFIRDVTNRAELEFNGILWQSEFRYVESVD